MRDVIIKLDGGEVEGEGKFCLGGWGVALEGLEALSSPLELGEEEVLLILLLIIHWNLKQQSLCQLHKELFVFIKVFGWFFA